MSKKSKQKKKRKHGGDDSASAATAKTDTSSKGQSNTLLSLQSRLKRERGTAATTPLPPAWKEDTGTHNSVLSPSDGAAFDKCLQRCYRGLSWEDPDELPQSLHRSFSLALDELNDAGLFLYDVIQPGGKRLSLTMVTRTLIGEPGSTYRYLGLRLFSHPWCDVDANGDRLNVSSDSKREKKKTKRSSRESEAGSSLIRLGYSGDCVAGLLRVGTVNDVLIGRTNSRLKDEIAPHVTDGLVGSTDYNLTLINKMEPSSAKRDLKNENIYGMGKTSVSWHKDSGLQDFSSIAVYHTLQEYVGAGGTDHAHARVERKRSSKSSISNEDEPWRVAVRVASANVKTPALAIPLPSGALYYLLDDFNHQHEHAVLAGTDKLRYSSTHRVAREGQGTWQYIRNKCEATLPKLEVLENEGLSNITNSADRKKFVKECRACQKLMTEIEFDWLRQWHVQGKMHADIHSYWHEPMTRLMNAYRKLERIFVKVVGLLRKAASAKESMPAVSEDLFDVMIEAIEDRHRLRLQWHERYRDPIFSSLSEGMKPMECPVLDRKDTDAEYEMTANLDKLGSKLRKWRASFLSAGSNNNASTAYAAKDNDKQPTSKRKGSGGGGGSLTKKEQKRVASNWQKMKSKMAKK